MRHRLPSAVRKLPPHRGLFLLVLALIPTAATGCATPNAEWYASLSPGWKEVLGAMDKAAAAYHTIADTPINHLLHDPAAKRRVSNLVTAARDQYRRSESYGREYLRSGFASWRILSQQGLQLKYVFRSKVPIFGSPRYWWEIYTLRGKLICHCTDDSGAVHWARPFRDIVIGDRIARIEALIAEIKR